MAGFQELIIKLTPILIGVAILLAGVTRLRKKLAKDASPSVGTYVNELGGYIVAAILALILGIYLLFFEQSSSVTNEEVPESKSSARVENAIRSNSVALRNTSAASNEPQNKSEASSPDKILEQFVGEWNLEIVTPSGTARGINKIVKIADEPFLLSRTYELRDLDVEADADKIVSLQAIWFSETEQAFKLAQMQRGVPILISTGKWIADASQFEWEMRVNEKLFSKSVDRFTNSGIQRTTSLYRDGQVAGSSTELLSHRHVNPTLPSLGTISQTDLKAYLGTWSYETFVTRDDEKTRLASGEVRVNSLGLEPVVLIRYYNDQRRLSEIQLMFSRGRSVSIPDGDRRVDLYANGRDGKVRKWYFNNAGVEFDLLGEIDLKNGIIEWFSKNENAQIRGKDKFSQPGLVTIAQHVLDDAGEVDVSFKTQWKRKE